MWELALLFLAAAALGFGLEALMLYLSRDGLKWLRLAPLVLLAVPGALAWQEAHSNGFLSGLAAVLWLIVALCGLCGWGAAWGIRGDGRG